ncbi:predicted protein [Nematostella vectensis]|uniref:Ig-like domain-containing protein n=1 Tax=Nematostella vectensis TaxID=45351 RepID=A7SKY3_NEMVE|nr:predicted protein [Nematostella vectensis]|eukprot:XP_001627741.1 predicted protein [Nematostella vectensis]
MIMLGTNSRLIAFLVTVNMLVLQCAESTKDWQWQYNKSVCFNERADAALSWKVTLSPGDSVSDVNIYEVSVRTQSALKMYSKTNGPEAAFKDRVMRFSMANELSNQFPVFKIYFTLTNLSSSVDGFGSKSIRCQVVRKSNGASQQRDTLLHVQDKPEKTKLIKLAPSGNVSDRYSTYAFRCIASAYPPVTSYTIYTNGIKRYTGTGIYYGYTHMLGAAEFTCEPHSAAGYGANSTVTIITIVDGHHFFPFNYLSGGGTVPEGSSLSFYCYLDLWHGNITWIKNGKRMNTVTTFYELRFDPVTRKDEGFYACGYIFNGVEYTVRHITHLTVEYKPEKTQLHSLGSSYCHGSAIPLYCTAVAKPADIRYFLRINNQPLANNTIGLFNVSLSRLGYHLYTCAPSNKVGEGEHRSVRIQVQEPLTSASILPINGTRFTEKSTVQLTCAANEVDSYEIRWTKDGVLVGEGQTLMIQSINRTDEGVYTCTINNTCNEVSAVTYIGVDYVNMDQQTLKCSSSPGFIILSLETNTASPPNITCNSGHASYRGLVAHSNGSVISYRVDLPEPDVSEVKCRAEGFPGTENTYTIAVADSEYIRNGSFRVTNARYPPSDAIKGKIIKSVCAIQSGRTSLMFCGTMPLASYPRARVVDTQVQRRGQGKIFSFIYL